jgi:hypothetical protein
MGDGYGCLRRITSKVRWFVRYSSWNGYGEERRSGRLYGSLVRRPSAAGGLEVIPLGERWAQRLRIEKSYENRVRIVAVEYRHVYLSGASRSNLLCQVAGGPKVEFRRDGRSGVGGDRLHHEANQVKVLDMNVCLIEYDEEDLLVS